MRDLGVIGGMLIGLGSSSIAVGLGYQGIGVIFAALGMCGIILIGLGILEAIIKNR